MNRFPLRLLSLRLPLVLACLSVVSLLLPIRFAAASGRLVWQPSSPVGLFITEFYYNPPGIDAEREWVEIANLSDQPQSLDGFGLGDEEQIGGGEGMLRFPPGSEIGAGEAVVIARSAAGFRALFGVNADYEVGATDTAVPDMIADYQWASGEVALANDGDEIILIDDQNRIVDALNYGDRTTFFTPSIPSVVSGQSVGRVPAICDSDSAVDWRALSYPTPGELIAEGVCNPPPLPEDVDPAKFRAIGEIQGVGDTSPLLNQVVTFRGLVTGVQEDQNASGVIYHTLFVQDVPGYEDGDPATSDAVAVFLGRQRPRNIAGDQIAVTGQVTEYFGLTEIDDRGLSIDLLSSSQTLPDAKTIELPQDSRMATDYLEAHEGMLVNTSGLLPVFGPTHAGCGFALGSTPDAERPIRHSGSESYVPPILVLNQSDVDCSALPALMTGDFVTAVAGPLTFQFDQYKVVLQDRDSLQVERAPTIPTEEPDNLSADEFRVSTLNLDNYLVPATAVAASSTERPAVEETGKKQRKLAYTISHTLGCPELLGLQEVESETLLLELAAVTARSCGFLYQVTHQDSADSRGIDVALLTDPRRVIVDAAELRQICSPLATGVHDSHIQCPPGEEPLFSRPPLETALRVDGEPLTIIVNHFKSKRGGERETAPRRMAQAHHVSDLVQNLLANEPQAAIIVLGDFNDYNLSPVWQQLQEGGVLYDAMQKVPAQNRYSYIFDGTAQLVDGILVSPALVRRIEGVTIPHVNADYPISLALDDSPSGLPYHASDHDPVLLTINDISHSSPSATVTAARIKPEKPVVATRSPATGQPTAVSATVVVASPTHQISKQVEGSSTPQTSSTPQASKQVGGSPTPRISKQVEASSTPLISEQNGQENPSGSTQYLMLAGLVTGLMATAVYWLSKRNIR